MDGQLPGYRPQLMSISWLMFYLGRERHFPPIPRPLCLEWVGVERVGFIRGGYLGWGEPRLLIHWHQPFIGKPRSPTWPNLGFRTRAPRSPLITGRIRDKSDRVLPLSEGNTIIIIFVSWDRKGISKRCTNLFHKRWWWNRLMKHVLKIIREKTR